jgi:PII-like signaling protein
LSQHRGNGDEREEERTAKGSDEHQGISGFNGSGEAAGSALLGLRKNIPASVKFVLGGYPLLQEEVYGMAEQAAEKVHFVERVEKTRG